MYHPGAITFSGSSHSALEQAAMCLAIPGKILSDEDLGFARTGRVQFGGIVRQVRLDFVPEAAVGDYVLVHVGFAISKIDQEEAQRTYQLLAEMGVLEEELPPEETVP
jgi:hydrogenase expression/formation protein HypC